MASFIIMSVQSQTFNILKNQVWLFLHFFFAILWPPVTWTSFARIEMAFLVPWSWTNFWQTWPHLVLKCPRCSAREAIFLMPQSLVTIVLSCLFRKSIHRLLPVEYVKKFFPYLWSSASSALSFSEGIEHSFGTSILGQLVDGSNSVTWAIEAMEAFTSFT